MSYEPVDIFVHEGSLSGPSLSGVVVRVFDSEGLTAFTQGVTDALGQVSLLLESGFTYQVRCYRFQTVFGPPLLIQVLAGTNTFDIIAQSFTPPLAADARLCVAYGYFRKQTLSAAPNTEIHFIGKFNPVIVDGTAVVSERSIVHTDKNGYVQVNLIRCAQYDVTLAGIEDTVRQISVPDAPNVNLPDLLFPVVQSVSFAEASPYVVQVGQRITLTPTIRTSSGMTLRGVGRGDVYWQMADDDKVLMEVDDTTISLYGRSAGTTELQGRRVDSSIIRIPYADILGLPINVTVTA